MENDTVFDLVVLFIIILLLSVGSFALYQQFAEWNGVIHNLPSQDIPTLH